MVKRVFVHCECTVKRVFVHSQCTVKRVFVHCSVRLSEANKKLFWKVTSAPVFKLSRQKALEFQYLSKCAQYNSWWLIAISLKCLNMTFLRQKGWQLSRLGWLFASSLSSALLLVWSQSFHKLVRYINMQSNAYWHFGQCHFLADIIFVKNITRPQFWAQNIYAKKA